MRQIKWTKMVNAEYPTRFAVFGNPTIGDSDTELRPDFMLMIREREGVILACWKYIRQGNVILEIKGAGGSTHKDLDAAIHRAEQFVEDRSLRQIPVD